MFDRFPLPYDDFQLNFGVQAVPADRSLIIATDEYRSEIELKKHLLETRFDQCWAATPDSLEAQTEAVRLLRSRCDKSHPLRSDPIENQPNGVAGSVGDSPLLAVSRLVQEDLVILRHDVEGGFPVIAGSVCFPSGWSIAQKLGQSQGCVHAAVPGFNQHLLSPSLKLFERLKSGRSVARSNWAVRALSRLSQFPSDADERMAASQLVNPQNAAKCMFRVEFQTLSRLAETRAILFTIHTFQRPLENLSSAERQRLVRVIETCPESTLRYKGIWPMRESLVRWLRAKDD
jgi:hypothetical protein